MGGKKRFFELSGGMEGMGGGKEKFLEERKGWEERKDLWRYVEEWRNGRIFGGTGRNGKDGRREGKIFGGMEGMGGKEGSLEVHGGMEGSLEVWGGMDGMEEN